MISPADSYRRAAVVMSISYGFLALKSQAGTGFLMINKFPVPACTQKMETPVELI